MKIPNNELARKLLINSFATLLLIDSEIEIPIELKNEIEIRLEELKNII